MDTNIKEPFAGDPFDHAAPLPIPAETNWRADYRLAFYRNQVIERYELSQIPNGEHLLVATEGSQPQIARIAGDRRVSRLDGGLDRRV